MSFDLSADRANKIAISIFALFTSVCLGIFCGLVYWENGFAGFIFGIFLGIVTTSISLFFMEHTANFFSFIFGEHKASFSNREVLESDMQQARFYKIKKDYDKALEKVNEILKFDSEHPEALFLKSQIAWEGYRNHDSAMSCLNKIHEIIKDQNTMIYRWSDSLMEEIESK